ncbi:MAG: hypothetical protein IJ282_04965 [Lachnospiraceae bacterium]|nr:hypothetical protein [Lachnospiraceae bacterium]
MSLKAWKIWKIILVAGSVLAALKLIFVDYSLDEEYQIVMAYKNLTGDALFKEMWEPHQTSAFLCAGLMRLYMAVTGTTTGIILFLRFVTLGIQLGLSYAVYRTLRHITEEKYAFLLTLIYFNIVPKNIQIPEFGNMQLWFLTIPLLLFLWYVWEREEKNKDRWYLVIFAGVGLACEVLVYPTCVFLLPFFIGYIWVNCKKTKWRDSLLLSGTCGVCGAVWLAKVMKNVGLNELLGNVEKMLAFDVTHDVSGMTDAKRVNFVDNFILWALLLLIIAAISAVILAIFLWIGKKRGAEKFDCGGRILIFLVVAIVVSEILQIYYWTVVNGGYEYPQIHLLVVWLAAAVAWQFAGGEKKGLGWVMAGTLIAYAGVMYISDLALYFSLPHGTLGIVACAAVILLALQKVLGQRSRLWISLLLISLCLCSIFGKGYTLRGGKEDNTIWSVGNIMKQGPAAGIFAEYMCAHIYNCNYEDYGLYLNKGDKVLIVANMIMSVGTTAYLFEDVEVCHYSVVDPTAYDERLLAYWEQYPQKAPNVIVVDAWFGHLRENPDSWIMQYIENEFGYTSVENGEYVRFYRK